MKRSIVSTSVFIAVFGITTLGVVAPSQATHRPTNRNLPLRQARRNLPASRTP